MELIKNTFSEEDAGKILRIPLARAPHDDFLVWGGEASGEFSVCNAYKLLQFSDENPRAYALQNIYRKFYKKTVAPKSTKKNQDYNLEVFIELSAYEQLDGLENRKLVNTKENRSWRRPPREFIKINFDGAYDGKNNISASGIVVRNEEGLVILSCLETHQGVAFAFAAEAVACQKAVQIGVENKWPEVIIEGDSLAIIKKCNSKCQDKSIIGAYISNIQQMTNRSKNFLFKHIPRPANVLAHKIATETLKRREEAYLERRVPEYAEN
ncbi:hypothetical protein CXB51_016664 [Gossypium anomalum]|uniref:RNase H type-1 domain-containing protein n=1 Tax=Gossypium anomalum TaxID=47600 RepID=A0A8J5YTK3_9ROSI|nr:hypothetical protein CXB51_016664 [Gossypium anomalum]